MRKRLREDIDELDPICNQAVGWGELLTVVTLLRPALLLIVRKTRRTSNGEVSLVGERSGGTRKDSSRGASQLGDDPELVLDAEVEEERGYEGKELR